MSTLLTFADALPAWLLAQAPPEPSLLTKILEPEVMFFGFLTTVIVVPSLAGIWFAMRTKEWEASLKHTMLERGMSAQEIQMVLDAGSGHGGSRKKGCMKSVPGNFSPTADYGPQQNT